MGYNNEHTEIIDIYEDISHEEKEKITVQQPEKQVPTPVPKNKTNKLLSSSIILIPIFSLMYTISQHSTELINERISVFSLIMLIILSCTLVLGIKKEIQIQRTKLSRILKFALSATYIAIFAITLFSLYGNDNLKYFLVDKAISTNNHHYLATWFYDDKTITDVLENLKEETVVEINDSNKLNFDEIKEIDTIYANKYEEEIMSGKTNQYKQINLQDGYLLVVYDLSKLELETIIMEEPIIETEEVLIEEEIIDEIEEKNLISFKDNKLTLETKELDNENYLEYKEVILLEGQKQNQDNKYNNETVIGQREDGIVLILVLNNKNLTNKDVTEILENYNVKNAVISKNSNEIVLDEQRVVVSYHEEN